MSPEEWAERIRDLIVDAEDDGMRFLIYDGDFHITAQSWDPEDRFPGDAIIIW